MKLLKKSIALILTIVMLISAVPVSCFSAEKAAAENLQTDVKELKVIGEVASSMFSFSVVTVMYFSCTIELAVAALSTSISLYSLR